MTLGQTFPLSCVKCTPSFSVTAVSNFLVDSGQWCVFVCRYLFALQIKQDISSGRLLCNDTSAALMVSHIIQCKHLSFSCGSRDHRVDRCSNIVMQHCIPSLIDYLYVAMGHYIALLLQNKYTVVCVQGILHSNKITNRYKQGMQTLCAPLPAFVEATRVDFPVGCLCVLLNIHPTFKEMTRHTNSAN